MKELTKAEEQIMHILWELKKAFVKDIMDRMDEPKPAYNTVSTIVRILETKGFVGHNAYGKTHEYFPLVEKDQYSKVRLKSMVTNYFSNSFKELVSFFTNENKLDITELEELKKIIEDEMKKKS